MPPKLVYAVNFARGNLSPENDPDGWGTMRLGGTVLVGSDNAFDSSDSGGLRLTIFRAAGSSANLVTKSVYVFPRSTPVVSPRTSVSSTGAPTSSPAIGAGDFDATALALSLDIRLRLSVEFDRPDALNDTVYPWAVALIVKAKDTEIDVPGEPMIPVTCQFNRGSPIPQVLDGARVNTPGSEQRDQQRPLYGPPLDYNQFKRGCLSLFPPRRFVLEHAFCGVGAAHESLPTPLLGYSVGSARLSIGSRWDMRVYSHKGLSNNATIGALGVSIVTQRGEGQFSARLRRFCVTLW